MDNIIKVKFEEWQDETYDDGTLWAEHYGQVLQVEGLTLPDGYIEVHFSLTEHTGDAHPYIGTVKDNVLTVNIPDFIFQKENVYNSKKYEAYAFIYQTDDTSGQTIKKITFTINARPKTTTDVPEDQKDQFLNEVRQVMAETKEIAQSVREDADNGVFDGPKGDKGDPGAIRKLIVPKLPTEDIDEDTVYLVKVTDAVEGDNKYIEYQYIEGEWEKIGASTYNVDLSEYVKNTDYSTATTAGVVKVNNSLAHGLLITEEGLLVVKPATNNQIDVRNPTNSERNTITTQNVDYAVQQVLIDSKIEWTDEQKQLARTLLNIIGTTDYAGTEKAGIVIINNDYGIRMDTNNALILDTASDSEILNKRSNCAVKVYQIDKAVKSGLVNSLLEWTDDEKASALELLGGIPTSKAQIAGSANSVAMRDSAGRLYVVSPIFDSHAATKGYVDGGFVGKISCESDDVLLKGLAYIVNTSNEQTSVELRINAIGGTIPIRDVSGCIISQLPTDDYHCANKKYIDDLFNSIVNGNEVAY